MTIGDRTAVPADAFSFRRSYISTMSITGVLGVPTQVGDLWFFPHPVLPNEDYYLVFRENWLAWSSNRWNLGWIVKEFYHMFTGDPVQHPVDYAIYFKHPTTTHKASLLITAFGVSTPPNYILLQEAPPSYWLPDA